MRINYNTTAFKALNSLNTNDANTSKSLLKLSSGLKVVSARDNPAGLAMSKRMNMQIEGVKQASNNTSDGISIAEVADGALTEVHAMLQRINELAVKANNGLWQDEDLKMMDDEVQQLMSEVERIARDTEFNGQPLFDGSWDLKGYTTNSLDVKVVTYSDDVVTGNYLLPANFSVRFNENGDIEDVLLDENGVEVTDTATGEAKTLRGHSVDIGAPPEGKRSLTDCQITSVHGNRITISDGKKVELTLDVKRPDTLPGVVYMHTGGTEMASLELELKGLGAMTLQTGANEHQVLNFRIPEISLQNLGLSRGADNQYRENLLTFEGAASLLSKTGAAIQYVSDARSRIGAYQNRLEHTVNNLAVTEENMTSAYSRIMDVDIAEEMTTFTSQQVLTQAATSMLTQANQRPSEVLQILQ